ncbi:hypothetical protein GCM10011504_39630 [Siccirubricoccus deserti]|nr:hypothetical protein GCM10011504_39630 [Siccirubricoccus deserti]
MGQHGLLAPHRVGRPEQRAHDGTITTTAVDVMWGTDMTETVTLTEGRAQVFVAVDHFSGEYVGNHAARSGNRIEALGPMRQGALRHFGRIEKDAAKGLPLRHDHGSNYMSSDFQDKITFPDIESSPSFVRQPEGNGFAERFIRTLKENFLWVHTFDTIEELRRRLQDFVAHCSATRFVARHGYRTQNQIRAEQRGLAQCLTGPTTAASSLILNCKALPVPHAGHRLEQRWWPNVRRLPPVHDRLDNIWCQQRQPQHLAETSRSVFSAFAISLREA